VKTFIVVYYIAQGRRLPHVFFSYDVTATSPEDAFYEFLAARDSPSTFVAAIIEKSAKELHFTVTNVPPNEALSYLTARGELNKKGRLVYAGLAQGS
jgi:hypothetical protein